MSASEWGVEKRKMVRRLIRTAIVEHGALDVYGYAIQMLDTLGGWRAVVRGLDKTCALLEDENAKLKANIETLMHERQWACEDPCNACCGCDLARADNELSKED